MNKKETLKCNHLIIDDDNEDIYLRHEYEEEQEEYDKEKYENEKEKCGHDDEDNI